MKSITLTLALTGLVGASVSAGTPAPAVTFDAVEHDYYYSASAGGFAADTSTTFGTFEVLFEDMTEFVALPGTNTLDLDADVTAPDALNRVTLDHTIEFSNTAAGTSQGTVTRSSTALEFTVASPSTLYLQGTLEMTDLPLEIPTGRMAVGDIAVRLVPLDGTAGGFEVRGFSNTVNGPFFEALDISQALEPGRYRLEAENDFDAGNGAQGNTRVDVAFSFDPDIVPEPGVALAVLAGAPALFGRRRSITR